MNYQPILLLLLAIVSWSCTDLRPQDIRRLTTSAEKGDLDAMHIVYLHQGHQSEKLVDDETFKRYEQTLLEHGFHKVIERQRLKEKQASDDDDCGFQDQGISYVDYKWMVYGAEHGSVPDMVKLGEYYHNGQTEEAEEVAAEKAFQWTRMAADSGSALAKMRLLRWQDEAIYMPTRSFRAGAEGWTVAREGNLIARLTSWTIYFVSTYVADIFVFLFSSSTWWQSLLGLLVLIAVFSGIYLFPMYITDAIHGRGHWPMLWTMVYGGVNGLVMVIIEFGGIMNGYWVYQDNYIAMNVGRFFSTPLSYSFFSDFCIWASWIWLIGLIGIFVYLIFTNLLRGEKPWADLLVILASMIMGYFYGAALTLLAIVVAAIYAFFFAFSLAANSGRSSSGWSSGSSSGSSSSSSSDDDGWDGKIKLSDGETRKVKESAIFPGEYTDNKNEKWKKDASGKFVKDE